MPCGAPANCLHARGVKRTCAASAVIATGADGDHLPATQVLILAPFRNRAAAIVQRLWQLVQAETRSDSVQHKDRFLDEFGGDNEDEQQVMHACKHSLSLGSLAFS